MAGILYIVATPIGNLEDITLRAISVLKGVSVIACEDTRETVKLLQRYEIEKKELISYHNFNEKEATQRILTILEDRDVALVSDAGTPLLSDPGFILIREAIAREITICPIPGVSALVTALSVSPIPTHHFFYEGFLPHQKGRKTRLTFLATLDTTIIFYESPYRIIKLLEELIVYFENCHVFVGREMTKKFEEFLYGTASEIKVKLESKKILGEFVVIANGRKKE